VLTTVEATTTKTSSGIKTRFDMSLVSYIPPRATLLGAHFHMR
jgi:hypothetical protein